MCGAKDCIDKFRVQFGRYPKYVSVECECTIKTHMLKGHRKRIHVYRKFEMQKQASDQHNYDT